MSLLKRIERARPAAEGEPQVPAVTPTPGQTPATSGPGKVAPPPAGQGTAPRPFLGALPTRESFRAAKYRVQNRLINYLDPKLRLSNPAEAPRPLENLF